MFMPLFGVSHQLQTSFEKGTNGNEPKATGLGWTGVTGKWQTHSLRTWTLENLWKQYVLHGEGLVIGDFLKVPCQHRCNSILPV
jgi:hypothetical protein